ncbi:MAG: cytochrome P450 [Ilumatobacteraceae bacterium]|nr:cytochrome P450 [Ilumatobacteraceae bacterium]
MTDTADLSEFGLFDPAIQQCPHAYYAKMQQDAPVYPAEIPGGTLHLVTRYDDVTEIVRDVATFSNRFDTAGANFHPELAARMKELYEAEGGYDKIGTMLTVDPPDHTRFRRLVTKAFTPKVIADLEPTIREITRGLVADVIAAMETDGKVEFVETFAVPLPVTVIAKALNVPDDRLADFKRWSDASIAGIGTNITIEERLEAEREVIQFQKYFAEQLELRRENPQGDILTNLLNARIDAEEVGDNGEEIDDRPLTMPEMLSIIQQLLVAGNETTTKALTEMMRLLGENPTEWDRLREDPSRAKAVFEETLRLSTPTQGMFRVVKADAEVAGTSLCPGDRAVVMYAAANRDPDVFPDPDTFSPDRDNLTSHLAFGKGVHFCLGAALSRLEGKVAAEELARGLASFRLCESNEYRYHPSFMLRGLVSLDVEVTPG